MKWEDNIVRFLASCEKYRVKLLLVGGGAVNFHGYQRHSADVDFWVKPTSENFSRLISAFQEMGYDIDDLPDEVRKSERNISIKFSPEELSIELITRFSINKTFDEAYQQAVQVEVKGQHIAKYRVLSFDDLIDSKVKAGRNKDLLDILELQTRQNKRDKQ